MSQHHQHRHRHQSQYQHQHQHRRHRHHKERHLHLHCNKNKNLLQRLLYTVFIAFTLLFIVSEAYTGLIPADPANPKTCIYRGDTLDVGVNNGISPCQRLTCYTNGSILIEGCGKLRFEECNHGERINLGKPFPECCKLRYKCKKPDGTPFYIERDTADTEATNKTENSA